MSPIRDGLPTLDEAIPFPGVPRYFRRRWDPPESGEAEPGVFVLPGPIVIYGYSCRSAYPEDWAGEDKVWRRRRAFPSVCYSTLAPDGEYGFTELAEAQEIPERALRAALEGLR